MGNVATVLSAIVGNRDCVGDRLLINSSFTLICGVKAYLHKVVNKAYSATVPCLRRYFQSNSLTFLWLIGVVKIHPIPRKSNRRSADVYIPHIIRW